MNDVSLRRDHRLLLQNLANVPLWRIFDWLRLCQRPMHGSGCLRLTQQIVIMR
jgi:hypothetical protein